MSTLASLAPDCIAILLEYLSENEIHALLSSGDRVLRRKTIDNVHRLEALRRRNEDFPFAALKLPQLRSFAVIGNYLSYLRFDKDDMTASNLSERRNSKLSSLDLQFPNSAALFCRPGSISLQERFPSLTELSLEGLGHKELVKSFAKLPKALTKLSLVSSFSFESDPAGFYLDEIAKLPRTIVELKLIGYLIDRPEERQDSESVAFEDILPPQLTSLALSSISGHTIISHLPKSLETIDLSFEDNVFEWRTSLLPQNLTTLKLPVSLLFDSPLPPRLVTFELPDDTTTTIMTLDGGNPNWLGLPLPFTLEFNVYSARIEDYRRLKHVSCVSLHAQSDMDALIEQKVENYPKRLFAETRDLRIQKLLPSSINELDLQELMYGDDVKMLPRRLEHLRVSEATEYNPVTFPPCWTIEQVGELPKSLTTLHLPFYLIGEGSKLAPISGTLLQNLRLSAVSSKQLKRAQEWLPSCLPPCLGYFSLYADRYEEKSEDTKISADCIRLCKLGEVVPHLSSLVLDMEFNNDAPMGPLFASLPTEIYFLYFERMSAVFQPGELSMTPRYLQYLTLVIDDTPDDESIGCITNEHFQGLPERLENFTMTPPANFKVDASVMKYLPNSLAEFLIQSSEASELCAKITEQLKNNSCPHYHDL